MHAVEQEEIGGQNPRVHGCGHSGRSPAPTAVAEQSGGDPGKAGLPGATAGGVENEKGSCRQGGLSFLGISTLGGLGEDVVGANGGTELTPASLAEEPT